MAKQLTPDWDAVEREQRETFARAVEAGDTGGMPLYVSDIRHNVHRARELGLDRAELLRSFLPPPGYSPRRGALTATEVKALFDEDWPT